MGAGRRQAGHASCLSGARAQEKGSRCPGKGIKAWGAADPDPFLSPPAGSRGAGVRKSGQREPNTPGSAEPRAATLTITKRPWAEPRRVKRQER